MGRVEDLIVYAKVITLVAFVAAGLAIPNPEQMHLIFNRNLAGVLVGGAIIFIAYEGFEPINNAINETKTRKRPSKELILIYNICYRPIYHHSVHYGIELKPELDSKI